MKTSLDAQEARLETRTNMIVMATIYGDASSAPVKIRNLSSHGALIEGAVIPPVGAKVRLSRGSLNIGGEVVWRRQARAGVAFDGSVSVAAWLNHGRSQGPEGRVDALLDRLRNAPAAIGPSVTPGPSEVTQPELGRAKALLEELASDLADDPAVVARHGHKLQSLDIAAQILGKLLTVG